MTDEVIPFDSKPGDYVRDTILIERQWDRILQLSTKNLLNYDNRSELKCALLGLESYIADVLERPEIKKFYDVERKKFKGGKMGSSQDEIDKLFMMMKTLKLVISQSPIAPPEVIDIDATDEGIWDEDIAKHEKELAEKKSKGEAVDEDE